MERRTKTDKQENKQSVKVERKRLSVIVSQACLFFLSVYDHVYVELDKYKHVLLRAYRKTTNIRLALRVGRTGRQLPSSRW